MKKTLIIILIGFITLLLSPFIFIETSALLTTKLKPIQPGYLALNNTTNEETASFFKSNESNYIAFDEFPSFVPDYLIALEDQNFYSHKGYDAKRIFKSLFDNMSSNTIVSGASTITQQLARLIYLSNEKSYYRKINEIIYARRLEKGLSKKRILELYLNLAYFGEDLYGIYSASQSYFHKTPQELSENEAILLLSLLPSPNNFSPRVDLNLAKERYEKAVKNLYYRKKINASIASYCLNFFPTFYTNGNYDIAKYWYMDSSYKELIRKGFDIKTINARSQININTFWQEYAQKLLIDNLSEDLDGAIIIMEVKTGNVISIIGGKDRSSFNRALDTNKAIGSVAKPILYTIALEEGFTPKSEFVSEEVTFFLDDGSEYRPHNASLKYANRKINMIEALATSDNIYATKLGLVIGTKSLSNRLSTINIHIPDNITNALGSFSLSLLELTGIYNALANNGVYHKPHIINSFTIGNSTYSNQDYGIQLFDSEKSRIMSYMLRAPFDSALKTYATPTMLYYPTNKRFAVKTGTTFSSSFVIGYNPYYTIGVYVGSDEDKELLNTQISKKIFQQLANLVASTSEDVFFSTENLSPLQLVNTQSGKSSFIYYQ